MTSNYPRTLSSREGLRAARHQVQELQEFLDEMRRKETPEAYAILCKSYVRRIRQIQQEIEAYLGVEKIHLEGVAV